MRKKFEWFGAGQAAKGRTVIDLFRGSRPNSPLVHDSRSGKSARDCFEGWKDGEDGLDSESMSVALVSCFVARRDGGERCRRCEQHCEVKGSVRLQQRRRRKTDRCLVLEFRFCARPPYGDPEAFAQPPGVDGERGRASRGGERRVNRERSSQVSEKGTMAR